MTLYSRCIFFIILCILKNILATSIYTFCQFDNFGMTLAFRNLNWWPPSFVHSSDGAGMYKYLHLPNSHLRQYTVGAHIVSVIDIDPSVLNSAFTTSKWPSRNVQWCTHPYWLDWSRSHPYGCIAANGPSSTQPTVVWIQPSAWLTSIPSILNSAFTTSVAILATYMVCILLIAFVDLDPIST